MSQYDYMNNIGYAPDLKFKMEMAAYRKEQDDLARQKATDAQVTLGLQNRDAYLAKNRWPDFKGGTLYRRDGVASVFANTPQGQQLAEEGGFTLKAPPGKPGSGLLQHYTGSTQVPLAAGQQEMINTVRSLLDGSQGNLKQLLSGTPNWGQFESGIAEPMRQSLQTVVQPKVNEAYSGSGTGSSFFSGARQNEQQNQSNALQSELAKLRYQEQQGATANSVQAMGQLTGLNSILSMETANDVDNMARQIATHYSNQGLTAQQAGIDLQNFLASLTQQGQEFDQDMQNRKFSLSEMLAEHQMNAPSGGGGGRTTQTVIPPSNWGMNNIDQENQNFFARAAENNKSYAQKDKEYEDAQKVKLASAKSGKDWWNT